MSTLKVGTFGNKTRFLPGEEVAGKVFWILDKPEKEKAVELRLFWYTQGKGTQDVVLADRARFDEPERRGEREFRFKLPEAPYSFSGKLISLVWALELVALRSNETERLEITVSPTGDEVALGSADEAGAGIRKPVGWWKRNVLREAPEAEQGSPPRGR